MRRGKRMEGAYRGSLSGVCGFPAGLLAGQKRRESERTIQLTWEIQVAYIMYSEHNAVLPIRAYVHTGLIHVPTTSSMPLHSICSNAPRCSNSFHTPPQHRECITQTFQSTPSWPYPRPVPSSVPPAGARHPAQSSGATARPWS